MTYRLDKITIRLKNDEAGINKINELFEDIVSGKIPLINDSNGKLIDGISPISEYSNYESDETGNYDFSVIAADKEFIFHLEKLADEGVFKKYIAKGADVHEAAMKAWNQVWNDEEIQRTFDKDYESTVPGFLTKDGKAHCYLYIGI